MKVCYKDNTARENIKSVKAARFSSSDGKALDIIGNIVSWSKGQIIDMITDKSEKVRVFTATVEDDKYLLGPEVEVFNLDEKTYLRAVGSSATRDDLDEVPVYEAHC
jgi:hypothetical protein